MINDGEVSKHLVLVEIVKNLENCSEYCVAWHVYKVYWALNGLDGLTTVMPCCLMYWIL